MSESSLTEGAIIVRSPKAVSVWKFVSPALENSIDKKRKSESRKTEKLEVVLTAFIHVLGAIDINRTCPFLVNDR